MDTKHELSAEMHARNTHKVPAKQWRKWSEHARSVFNNLYENMVAQQEVFRHVGARKMPTPQWEVVAWNASWVAACAASA